MSTPGISFPTFVNANRSTLVRADTAITHGRQINSGNTGLNYHGVSEASLTLVAGGQTLSTAGQTVTGKKWTGQVSITANNVTVRDCLVENGGVNSVGFYVTGANVTIEGCRVRNTTGTSLAQGIWLDVSTGGLTVTRVEVSGCENEATFYAPNVHIQESYLHDNDITSNPSGHPDVLEVRNGGTAFIDRCRLNNGPAQPYDGCINVSPFGSYSVIGVDVFDNFIDGGQSHLLIDNLTANTNAIQNIRVLRNDFGGHTNVAFFGNYYALDNADTRTIYTTQAGLDGDPNGIYWPSSGGNANRWAECSDLVPDRTGQYANPS